jgi:hypothetical protein
VRGQEAARAGSPSSQRKPETINLFLLKIPKIVLEAIYNSSYLIIGKYSNNSNNANNSCKWALSPLLDAAL